MKFTEVLSIINHYSLTMSLIENPLVHLISIPEETDVCFTGKEKVNPRSLFLLAKDSEFSPSLSTNFFKDDAIKSKSSYIQPNSQHKCPNAMAK